jgi:hypothetical protein
MTDGMDGGAAVAAIDGSARERILAWRDTEIGGEPTPPPAPRIVDAARHIRQLRAALRRERMRGRAGHWTYDLARHLSLARQLRRAEAADGGKTAAASAAPTNVTSD